MESVKNWGKRGMRVRPRACGLLRTTEVEWAFVLSSVILSKRSASKNPFSFVSAYGIRGASRAPPPLHGGFVGEALEPPATRCDFASRSREGQ